MEGIPTHINYGLEAATTNELPLEKRPYGERKAFWVDSIYICAILIWLIFICYFRLYASPGAFVLWLPPILFLIALVNINNLTLEVEADMFKANYLSIGLLVVLPLLAWMSRDYAGDRSHFVTVIMLAMVLTLLSLIDVWVAPRWLTVYKHARSCIQTMAIGLLIYAIVAYCMQRPSHLALG
ncbi:Hypothetical protein POVN_LOCUS454 [uncultured virus]|nr:Hypothetical protein POVN_LOCUS454 [uncultured virus]